MKAIDVRFNADMMTILQGMIGDRMIKIMSDPFMFSTAVYGIVGVCTDRNTIKLTNLVEATDYYGAQEDVAILKLSVAEENEIHSLVQGQEMIKTPVDAIIRDIMVVNEHQKLYRQDEQIYDVWLTRGLIIQFEDGHEISFEKNIWFSEDISVEKGYDLISKFSPVEEFEEGWENELRGECSRQIVSVSLDRR